jgi:hypothetical protein
MAVKTFVPKTHGIADYIIAGLQLSLPMMLGVNKKATNAYRLVAGSYTAINALTDTPVGLKRLIPMKTHKRIDAVALGGLALMTAAKFIRNDKKALWLHVGFLATALTNFALTDYNR